MSAIGRVVHILSGTVLQAVAATVQYHECNRTCCPHTVWHSTSSSSSYSTVECLQLVLSANNIQPASLHQNSSCLGSTVVPQVETVKYLGRHFDKCLTWKNHVTMKRKQLDLKTREMYWLIGKHSPIVGKQASHLQNIAKTSVDLRNRTIAMCY
jgi:hypothetical protein